jgi:hypothetical protein
MIIKMFEANVIKFAPRVASWCAGYLTDEELVAEFATNKNPEAYLDDGCT